MKYLCGMQLNTARKIIKEQLEPYYEDNEIQRMSEMLLEWAIGLDRSGQIANPKKELTEEQQQLLHQGVSRLRDQEPIQYITGQAWFAGMAFNVGPAVLIPRPETEELVDWVLKENGPEKRRVLDIGTGTGCIPVSLKKSRPAWEVSAIDISAEAIAMATENANRNEAPVQFQVMDFSKEQTWTSLSQFNLIISNPPYIPWSDWTTLPENVREHEPTEALFVPDETPLLFYQLIARFALQHLSPEGIVYVEINETLGNEVIELFQASGFTKTELREDMQGKKRMVKAWR